MTVFYSIPTSVLCDGGGGAQQSHLGVTGATATTINTKTIIQMNCHSLSVQDWALPRMCPRSQTLPKGSLRVCAGSKKRPQAKTRPLLSTRSVLGYTGSLKMTPSGLFFCISLTCCTCFVQHAGPRATPGSVVTSEGSLAAGDQRHVDPLSAMQAKAKCKHGH